PPPQQLPQSPLSGLTLIPRPSYFVLMRKKKKTAAAVRPGAPALAQQAFEEVLPRLGDISPDDLVAIKVDIPTAASIALGASGRLAELRPQVVAQLPKHPVELFDELPRLALAAWYAHLMDMPATGDK